MKKIIMLIWGFFTILSHLKDYRFTLFSMCMAAQMDIVAVLAEMN